MPIDVVECRGSVRFRIYITGIVQGVGFRPFVYNTAILYGIKGWVMNDTNGVLIEAESSMDKMAIFLAAIENNPLPLAHIDAIKIETLDPLGEETFSIKTSNYARHKDTLISPDIATCEDCLKELFDENDRRYRYPFINCINCGPRFSITTDIPYDRENTTMREFEMCAECKREYEDYTNRRFHAQPIACPKCGPSLKLYDFRSECEVKTSNIYTFIANEIQKNKIIAIKGIGGYHLCLSAVSEKACTELRTRKRRYAKPLAVMVKDIETVKQICDLSEEEEAVLLSPEHPIVLLRKKEDSLIKIAFGVAFGSQYLGVMLPYTPLHHLLLSEVEMPLVMTSGNLSDEPIEYLDDEAKEHLCNIADFMLSHDRGIAIRVDDSVTHVIDHKPYFIRRSRGFAPRPIKLPFSVPQAILACGAELKSTFCLAKGEYAFLSHHLGDLENYKTYVSFSDAIKYYEYIFDVDPKIITYDLHPEYLSTKFAYEKAGVDPDPFSSSLPEQESYMRTTYPEQKGNGLLGVYHHHAHVASCMVDNNRFDKVIGFAFDGSGYGTDGSLWGSEVFIADFKSFQRLASLAPIPLLGGSQAVKEPWRIAAYHIHALYGDDAIPQELSEMEVYKNNELVWPDVLSLTGSLHKVTMTTGMGRLFDAVSSLLCGVDKIDYEGQAAIELESIISTNEKSSYPLPAITDLPVKLDPTAIFACVLDDIFAKTDQSVISARFHNTIVQFILNMCIYIRQKYNLDTVALSGGVFQNRYLLDHTLNKLKQNSFKLLIHNKVPANDAGISLGQVAIAAHVI